VRRISAEDRIPSTVTMGTTVLSDMVRASSGTVTPPKPALPRMA
jgi:hypothetical protein